MGNRAVITFDKQPTKNSVGIYLHWNGGPESVLAFLEAADKLNVRDDGDPSYQLARVVQIISNWFGGTLSVGVATLGNLDCENHDNGVYAVSRNGKGIEIRHSPTGKLNLFGEPLDLAKLREHEYWKGDEPILESVLKKNLSHFGEET